jgi:hypothetical protein
MSEYTDPRYDAKLLHDGCADDFMRYQVFMSTRLYAEPPNYIPPTRWQTYRDRIKDAWAVLTGKAHVGDGYE